NKLVNWSCLDDSTGLTTFFVYTPDKFSQLTCLIITLMPEMNRTQTIYNLLRILKKIDWGLELYDDYANLIRHMQVDLLVVVSQSVLTRSGVFAL
ncbi:TPA: hypothetical protein ACS5O8_002731, partial [Escherichia coli]